MDKATRNVHPLAIPVRFAPCTGKRSADGIDVQSQDAFSTGGVRRFASHEIWTTEILELRTDRFLKQNHLVY